MKKLNLLLIVLFLLVIVSCSINKNPKDDKPTIIYPKVQLTNTLRQEICREIKVYMEYCYDTGIDTTTCADQITEKVPRIFEITANQYGDVLEYCMRNNYLPNPT